MIKTLIQNKHTSIAALAWFAGKAVAGFGAIWFPHYKDQFQQTAELIESLAVGYGLIMAGDAKPSGTLPPSDPNKTSHE